MGDMTVAELIAALQDMPANAIVMVPSIPHSGSWDGVVALDSSSDPLFVYLRGAE